VRVADQTRATSSLSGRHTWGIYCEPEVASKLFGAEFDIPFAEICARREAMRQANITGKFNVKAAGFSPSGNVKLCLEVPYCIMVAAKAAFGSDVFTNRKKRHLFAQEFPAYAFNIHSSR